MINRKLNWLLPLLFLALSGCEAFVVGGIVTGLGTGIAVSEDRRTSGTFVEDEGIEFTSAQLIREKTGKNVHVNVTSFNRNALLTGEVPSELIKKDIEELIKGVKNVRNVTNGIVITSPTSTLSRYTDMVTTTKVKGRFLDGGRFQINHVKVVTENGTVYLLGLVKRQEAESASEIASSTSGVQRVVKVFEYLD
ncbi:MAG: BON domain-containing protein [Nitrosomonadaceae bacterium]|jgi:osmotically-inducible protein OsmY|nr:BON domain-containing protein [Nitrosospira sp.]MDW7565065.1 BON domain-containing protein [Nitrosomonadaceae bacterium]MBI0408558.1 BON domain-containing protein [Nitrosospira sp.]MBI0410598.1 BON domain-containing protein [Nitrosospira sp.]MBI0411823.1 BON domain-containing protein [Nitrosospira sp.]